MLAALLVLVLAGTTAFMRIGGWPAGDALWMTIITVTAVGYEEVEQIDQLTASRAPEGEPIRRRRTPRPCGA
ncbi:MAG: ion channel [Gemmatimonadota bacterium]